jgi:hypothetical protein
LRDEIHPPKRERKCINSRKFRQTGAWDGTNGLG